MGVSRRVRFEVLRRDGHRCYYCGASAADVQLTVDHVVPVALGGTDDASNLVAACAACNSGKTSTGPDEPLVAQVRDDAARWAQAMAAASAEAAAERENLAGLIQDFDETWRRWQSAGQPVPRDSGWERSVETWLNLGLLLDELVDLVPVAMASKVPPAATWKYFAGCAWKVLRQRQERARQILQQSETTFDVGGGVATCSVCESSPSRFHVPTDFASACEAYWAGVEFEQYMATLPGCDTPEQLWQNGYEAGLAEGAQRERAASRAESEPASLGVILATLQKSVAPA